MHVLDNVGCGPEQLAHVCISDMHSGPRVALQLLQIASRLEAKAMPPSVMVVILVP